MGQAAPQAAPSKTSDEQALDVLRECDLLVAEDTRVARRLLRPGGLLAVEHGAPQGAAVYWVFPEEAGWRDTRNHKDLARRDRFVTTTWPGDRPADDADG